jgi:2-polyprenyl-3-methyl-5-hydroxy-6-metoxy-1,4-benzoquinol methylase
MKAQQTWSTPVRRENTASIPCTLCGGMRFLPSLECKGYGYVKCADCGLVQINPQPEKNAVHERYGENYLQYELANEENFFKLGKLALDDAEITKIEAERQNNRVLEIGCATGALLEYLAARGWDVSGVEISAPQAEYAARVRGLSVSPLPLEENRFPAGRFSLVIASHLIEHLNDPSQFVREVSRIIMPGGVFLVTTPNRDGLQARIFGSSWRSVIFDHLYLFSRKTLSSLLIQAEFEIEKTVTWGGIAQGFAPPAIKKIVDKAAKFFGFGDVMLMKCRRRL